MHDSFPMTVGSLLRESVDVYVRNWRPFTIMSLNLSQIGRHF